MLPIKDEQGRGQASGIFVTFLEEVLAKARIGQNSVFDGEIRVKTNGKSMRSAGEMKRDSDQIDLWSDGWWNAELRHACEVNDVMGARADVDALADEFTSLNVLPRRIFARSNERMWFLEPPGHAGTQRWKAPKTRSGSLSIPSRYAYACLLMIF